MSKSSKNYLLLKEKISQVGMKPTQQRIVIYDAILKMKTHPTAEIIFEKVQKDNPSISLGTVYKTLETLISAGLVNKVHTNEGNMRYDANLNYHNHIYCTNTKEIFDYYSDDLAVLLKNFFREKKLKNLDIKDIRLQINAVKINPGKDVEII